MPSNSQARKYYIPSLYSIVQIIYTIIVLSLYHCLFIELIHRISTKENYRITKRRKGYCIKKVLTFFWKFIYLSVLQVTEFHNSFDYNKKYL